MDIGQQIRTARESRVPAWSRATLAELSGVSARTIERIETGQTSKPSVEDVARLCRALGLDLAKVVEAAVPRRSGVHAREM